MTAIRLTFLSSIRAICRGLILLTVLASPCAAQQRIVAVGDVHGAFTEFVAILQRVGLIDTNLKWTGGSAVLVQTGDVMDRGPGTRQAMDLLMDLEAQAAKQGGKVIPLLGNHEVMNLVGDLRYVTPADYASFATDQSEKTREEQYRDYRQFLTGPPLKHTEPDDEAARQAWMAQHPPGYFEQREALGPSGKYGRWLRQHDAVAQVGDVIFLHGGLDPKLRFHDIDDLNNRIHSELDNFDSVWQSLSRKNVIWRYMTLDQALHQTQKVAEAVQSGRFVLPAATEDMRKFLGLPEWLLISQDSPLWYRGLALEPEDKLEKGLDKMLGRLKAHYIVAAHTVRPKFDIMSRFDNRVFLIDTGMLHAYFGGRASALEIQGGRFAAYYGDMDKPVVLVGPGAVTTTPGSGK